MEAMNQLWVTDVTVVDGYQMQETWNIKVPKYGQPNRVTAVHVGLPSPLPLSTAVLVLSYCGWLMGWSSCQFLSGPRTLMPPVVQMNGWG